MAIMEFSSIFDRKIPFKRRWLRHLRSKHLHNCNGKGSKFLCSVDIDYLIKITLLCGRVVKSDRKSITLSLHVPFIIGRTDTGRCCYEIRIVIGCRPHEILTVFPNSCGRQCVDEHSRQEACVCIDRHLSLDGLLFPCTCACDTYQLVKRSASRSERKKFGIV